MFDGAVTFEVPEIDRMLSDRAGDVSVLVTDPWLPENPIVFVSPEFSAQTGYSAAEATGRSLRLLEGPDTDPAAIERLEDAVRHELPISLEILSYRRDGTPFWNLLQMRPCFASSGRLTHFIAVQREIVRPVPRHCA